MAATSLQIMIVDDEPAHAEAIRRALEAAGTTVGVRVAGTLREYREQIAAHPPDVALLDLNLPDGRAVEALKDGADFVPFPILIMTSYGNEQTVVEALKAGAFDYVVKSPEAFAAIPRTVERVRREWMLIEERKRSEMLLRSRLQLSELAQHGSLAELLQLTIDAAEACTGSGIGFFHFIDGEQKNLSLQAWSTSTLNQQCRIDASIPHHPISDAGIWADSLASAKPVVCNDYARLRRQHKLPVGHPPVERFLTVPIVRDGQIVSILGVGNKPTAYTQADADTLQELASMGMDLVARKQAEDNLKRLNRTLRVLSRCNESLVHETDEQGLLQAICDNLVQIGGYPLAWVGLVGKEGLKLASWSGTGSADLRTLHRPPLRKKDGVCPTDAAVKTGRLQLLPRLGENIGNGHLRPLVEHFGIIGIIAFPLSEAGKVIGTLTIGSDEEDAFDAEEVKLLTELAKDLEYGIVTIRAAAVHRLAQEALLLRNRAIEASRNGIMICDAGDDALPILYVNPAFEQMTGYKAAEAQGRNPGFLAGQNARQQGLLTLVARLRRHQEVDAEMRIYRRDGSPFWCDLSVAPVRDAADRITHYVAILDDVTERKRYEEELEHQATHDALTGLANRNMLSDRLEQSLIYAGRSQRLVAILLLDLDRFKVVNDSLGHGHGDELLRLVAARLNDCVRPGDTVSRLGGDEFVITLAEVAELDDVGLTAQRLRDKLAEPFSLAGHELRVATSIGISLYPRDGDTVESLIRHADIAMYRAKEEGGDTFRFFAPEMHLRVQGTLQMEADLRAALKRGEFCLHYQPKVDIATGRITGCEALVRWQHPERGMVAPGTFIPLAEETGLIVPLGDWVLQTACAQARAWQDEGLPQLPVAVNLSARQFRHAGLVDRVKTAIADAGLAPETLALELTESMIMHDPAGAAETMRHLKKIGVGLCLDDFGTGYSSLNYLRRFPVDYLKIDRSFITDVAFDPSGAAVVRSIIAIAHSLAITAVAEGVESWEQFDFLSAASCDALQGFLFSKPLPPAGFSQLLRTGTLLRAP